MESPTDKKFSAAIAIMGSPNAGKSTLINRLVNKKISIVTDKPQTTENRILGILTEQNCQLLFYDTPGIGKPIGERAARVNRVAEHAAHETDIILFVIDMIKGLGENDKTILKSIEKLNKPVIVALNKMDLSSNIKAIPIVDAISKWTKVAEFIPISALTGDNVDTLISLLKKYAPENNFIYEAEEITDMDDSFAAAEFIREQIYLNTEKEIPYHTTVTIEEIRDNSDTGISIDALINVENERHRGMLIGDKGSFIKKIRLFAQKRLRDYFEQPVKLSLIVKAKKPKRGGKFRNRR